MSMTDAARLPAELLNRASLRGNEYAWPLADIPNVIEAARVANLLNIGGQLQFRLPDGGICECYWVEVDTFQTVSKDQPWKARVEAAANEASAAFGDLPSRYDFVAEGRKAFAEHLDKLSDPASAMCFVWDVMGENDEEAAS